MMGAVNKNEAPLGYEAVPGSGGGDDCDRCCFTPLSRKCSVAPCLAEDRHDKCNVYFATRRGYAGPTKTT